MSKGSKVIRARVPAALLECIEAEIEKHNANPLVPPMTVSDWIRRASEEWLAKRARSRGRRKEKKDKDQLGAGSASELVTDRTLARS